MADEAPPKWEGKLTAELIGATAEQIWPLLEDFCSIDKLLPDVDTCYRVEGAPGQPGLVRRCEGKHGWADEKILTIDPTNRCLSYAVMENNVGFKNYVATVQVLPTKGSAGGQPAAAAGAAAAAGCKIDWSFVADPVEGWRLEDLVSYIDNTLQFMAKKMEESVKDQI